MNAYDVTHPPISVVIKLGSIARHADEGLSKTGHPVDIDAILALLNDQEVKEWMAAADEVALLPVKR